MAQPIVAIGGINSSNIVDVVKAGADSVCVVSAITFADDPRTATAELVELYESAKRLTGPVKCQTLGKRLA